MTTINKERLYILGAGFSHSYDNKIFPLTNELLVKAFDLKLLNNNKSLESFLKSIFNNTGERINFEKVASFLYYNPFSSEGEPKQTYELLYIELISIIAKIYGYQTIIQDVSEKWKIETMKSFANHLHKTDSTIISFNYDLLVENFLKLISDWDPLKGYHMPFYPPSSYNQYYSKPYTNGASILKLHGSLNWGLPPEEILNPKFEKNILDKKNYSEPIFNIEYQQEFFTSTRYYPYLIPPVSGKIYENNILRNLWKKAKAAMQVYSEIHIIGYSLPESDTSVEFLFRLGSVNSMPFGENKIIHIVDPFIQDKKKEEFSNIFRCSNPNNHIKFHPTDAMTYLANLNMNID